jgi:hypothetical protein
MIKKHHRYSIDMKSSSNRDSADDEVVIDWIEGDNATATITVYSASDEIIFNMTPNRAGELMDVLDTYLKSVKPIVHVD